jgi:hypothetical protein
LRVQDFGQRFSVSIAEQTREYLDEKRDCEERARVAAVFAALTLEPPDVAEREKRSVGSNVHVEFRFGGQGEASRQGTAWGGEARAAWVGESWGAEAGIAGQSPVSLSWGAYHAHLLRVPFDIGVRGQRLIAGQVAVATVGLTGALVHLDGQGQAMPVHDAGTRVDVGARCSLSAIFWPSARVSPYASVHASVWPRAYSVVVDPVGKVGTTPQLWVGVSLGLALGAR